MYLPTLGISIFIVVFEIPVKLSANKKTARGHLLIFNTYCSDNFGFNSLERTKYTRKSVPIYNAMVTTPLIFLVEVRLYSS